MICHVCKKSMHYDKYADRFICWDCNRIYYMHGVSDE